tara:strand:- start:42600 stop:43079 length:480 start_codon:yes stop_codon:yes gene_type:complete
MNKKEKLALKIGLPIILLMIFSPFILGLFGVESNNVVLGNATEAENYIQGKWTGTYNTSYGGGSNTFEVRFLIEGDNVTSWSRLVSGYNMGSAKATTWKYEKPKFSNERLSISKTEDGGFILRLVNKPLSKKFRLSKNGTFSYGSYTMKNFWDEMPLFD